MSTFITTSCMRTDNTLHDGLYDMYLSHRADLVRRVQRATEAILVRRYLELHALCKMHHQSFKELT